MVLVNGITTCRSGSALSFTFTVSVPPSATVYVACSNETVTAGSSSSAMLTVDSDVVPAVTPSGSVPKPSFTLSPSSSTVSAVAEKVKDLDVSVAPNVTLAGTPE